MRFFLSLYRKQTWITWRMRKRMIRYSVVFSRRRNCGIPNQGHSMTFHVKWKHFKWKLIKSIHYHSLPMWLNFFAKQVRWQILDFTHFWFKSTHWTQANNWPFSNDNLPSIMCYMCKQKYMFTFTPFWRSFLKAGP